MHTDDAGAAIFSPEDFESAELAVLAYNHTSRANLQRGYDATVLELGEGELVISMPPKSCARGHQLVLQTSLKWKALNVATSITARVTSQEELPGGAQDRVALKLVQCDAAAWQQVTDFFESRQSEIFQFFRAVKGNN